jgi:hypothetical protein
MVLYKRQFKLCAEQGKRTSLARARAYAALESRVTQIRAFVPLKPDINECSWICCIKFKRRSSPSSSSRFSSRLKMDKYATSFRNVHLQSVGILITTCKNLIGDIGKCVLSYDQHNLGQKLVGPNLIVDGGHGLYDTIALVWLITGGNNWIPCFVDEIGCHAGVSVIACGHSILLSQP